MSGGRNPILTKVFAVVGIVVVSLATWATLELIFDLWNPPYFDKSEEVVAVEPKIAEMRSLALGLNDNKTIEYTRSTVLAMPVNFHAVTPYAGKDAVSLCVNCHGIVPHIKSVDKRAYRNMHSTHISCETCHIGGQGRANFAWYNTTNGVIENKLEIKAKLTTSDYKIYSTYGIKPEGKYDKSKLIADANSLLVVANTLSKEEREKRIKPFHEGLLEESKAIDCNHCHDENSDFIPLLSLGYSKERIHELNNSEIIGLLTKYKEFYLPTFLTPEDDNSDIEDVLISPRKK